MDLSKLTRKQAEVETTNDEQKTNTDRLTHAYAHWLADVHSGSFAPAFTLSFHDSECSRKPPNAHSLGRYLQAYKKKDSAELDKEIKK
jgi:hypothetical protein